MVAVLFAQVTRRVAVMQSEGNAMRKYMTFALVLTTAFMMAGCGSSSDDAVETASSVVEEDGSVYVSDGASGKIEELQDGLSYAVHTGDDGFADFIQAGGASSDREVVSFLTDHLLQGDNLFQMLTGGGCSTIAVADETGDRYFGRNFDWYDCNALIVKDEPEEGYASISTVNLDFITQAAGARLPDQAKVLASVYAPLDGMNEEGLAISVNMIEDSDTIAQITDRPDLTTTTAVRLLLNEAADVEEALELLRSYDLHASFGYMIHFAIADRNGRSVAVEYVGNQMSVTDTPVLTNFYITEGEKYGIGTVQSHERFQILQEALENHPEMSFNRIRDTLSDVSKEHWHDGETTEWSVIYNLTDGSARYYHREDYSKSWIVRF